MTTYRLFSGTSPGDPSYTGAYTIGMQFSLSSPQALTGIWWWSQATDDVLPTWCGIWDVAAQTIVAGTGNSSPSWSGAPGSGWVSCAYDGSVVLADSHNYLVAVVSGAGAASSHTVTSSYFTAPVTVGPITAPDKAGSAAGQDVYVAGTTPTYPNTDSGGINLWVDVEVSTPTIAITGTGGLRLPAMAIGGDGAEAFHGTGGLHLPAMSLHGTGAEKITGTGGLRLPAMAAQGTGHELVITGTGSLAMPRMSVHSAQPVVPGSAALTQQLAGQVSLA